MLEIGKIPAEKVKKQNQTNKKTHSSPKKSPQQQQRELFISVAFAWMILDRTLLCTIQNHLSRPQSEIPDTGPKNIIVYVLLEADTKDKIL